MPARKYEWFDRKRAARHLTISERKLVYLTDVGEKLPPKDRIPSHLIGRRRLYRRDELDAYVLSLNGRPPGLTADDYALPPPSDDRDEPPRLAEEPLRAITYEDIARFGVASDGSIRRRP